MKPIYSRQFSEADTGTTGGGAGNQETQGKEGGESKPDANAGGESGGKGDGFKAITTQEDLDAALAARLVRHEAKVRKSITDEVKANLAQEAKDAKAKEENDYKALYEASEKKREVAESERDTERQTTLRNRIAAKHKLPDELADVLKGATEEELEEHAKRLAKVVTARKAPDTEVGTGTTGNNGSGSSDRPKTKSVESGQPAEPVYTFDGQKKIPFPNTTR